MERRSLAEGINCAIEGFIYVFKTQKAMRYHFAIGALVLILGIYFQFSRLEILVLSITITSVLVAEMLNTIVELMVDLMVNVFHPVARVIKDISAGIVLLAAIDATVIGYLLFFRSLVTMNVNEGILTIKQSSWHLTFISIIAVFTLVLFMKIIFHRGTPMRGGMPSGHAAISFSFWAAISLLTKNEVAIFLTFILAALVSRERIRRKVHNLLEVVMGAIIGALVTVLIFQIFKI